MMRRSMTRSVGMHQVARTGVRQMSALVETHRQARRPQQWLGTGQVQLRGWMMRDQRRSWSHQMMMSWAPQQDWMSWEGPSWKGLRSWKNLRWRWRSQWRLLWQWRSSLNRYSRRGQRKWVDRWMMGLRIDREALAPHPMVILGGVLAEN